MFVHDRDLLALEPELFADVGWRGQRLLTGTGDLHAGILTLSVQDVSLVDAGIGPGHVVILTPDGGEPVPLEVLERLGADEIRLSRLRVDPAAPPLPPPDLAGAGVTIWTFAPQIALVHAELMRLIGIDAELDETIPGDCDGRRFTTADILNPGAVRAVEALGALALIYSAAATPGAPPLGFQSRADRYRQRFVQARQRTPVHLGLDSAGCPIATRRFNTAVFHR